MNRLFADRLAARWGKPVLVENPPVRLCASPRTAMAARRSNRTIQMLRTRTLIASRLTAIPNVAIAGSASFLSDEIREFLAGRVRREPDEERCQQQKRACQQRQASGDGMGGRDPAHDHRRERGDTKAEGEGCADAGTANLGRE